VQTLKKDSKRADTERRRLELLNEKQRSVLQRKIHEAEEARKRLASVNARRRPPARAAASAGATATSRGASEAGAAPAASAGTTAPPFPASQQPRTPRDGVLRPNPSAPPLPDAAAMEAWVRDEIEEASTAHMHRAMLGGKLAARGEVARRATAAAQRLTELDALPPAERVLRRPFNALSCCTLHHSHAGLGLELMLCAVPIPLSATLLARSNLRLQPHVQEAAAAARESAAAQHEALLGELDGLAADIAQAQRDVDDAERQNQRAREAAADRFCSVTCVARTLRTLLPALKRPTAGCLHSSLGNAVTCAVSTR
jgi:hypothetical protein